MPWLPLVKEEVFWKTYVSWSGIFLEKKMESFLGDERGKCRKEEWYFQGVIFSEKKKEDFLGEEEGGLSWRRKMEDFLGEEDGNGGRRSGIFKE
ncbi:unnamed protein product [Prunus armeniaca]|uniref:Uncharacterized protein n=1 Tax=Prunus armeniaca TaxID=36596 RepID=A0A6J5WG40_PRUAR|nr:unnamed protein product [Prunus armeniaca]CAB4300740.1 unnamed protein product [Prunus armeniaca]